MRTHKPSALRLARSQRKQMSLPEILLWRVLRKRPEGLKFRNQHPFGPFVADFYCDEAKLAVEIDGEAHNMGDRPLTDPKRDAFFRRNGISVLRIPARDVLANLENAVTYIVAAAGAAVPPPSALRAATSPKGGGSTLER